MNSPSEAASEKIARSTRLWLIGAWVVGGIIIIATLIVLLYLMATNSTLRDALEAERAAHAETQAYLRDSEAKTEALYEQLLDAGEDPVVEPTTAPAPTPERGPQGTPGPMGPQGPKGATGDPGDDGLGIPGANGEPGASGSTGPRGEAGPAGPQGETGVAGPAGPQGEQGPVGAQGPPGPACPDGYTLDTVWLSIAEEQFGLFSRQPAAICRPNE